MNRKQALTVIFIFAFLFSFAAGFSIVKADSASDFSFASGFRIDSPINRTYTSRSLILNASFGSLVGANINHSLTYSLDGTYMGNIPIVGHYPNWLSFQGFFTGTVSLPELSKGLHTITVFAMHNIYNFANTPKNTQLENAAVIFNISDTIPANELTPPVISDLTVENKSYPFVQLSLNFSVDKAVMWTGYCLDDRNWTITDWWNTPTSVRSFNATLKALTEGSHTLVVYGEDTFGNNGASEIVNFAVDATPPKVSLLSIENKTYDSASVPLNFELNETVSQISYSLDGQSNVSISGNSTLTGLPNGLHNVTVYAWDETGNIGASATTSFNVKVRDLFPTTFAAASGASAAVVGVGLVVYFKKHRR